MGIDLDGNQLGRDCDGTGGDDWGIPGDDCVEPVDGVSVVVDGPPDTIGFNQAVRSLDDISVSGLFLSFGVSGEAIVHAVGELVLWVSIVQFPDLSYSHWGWCYELAGEEGCGSDNLASQQGGRKSVVEGCHYTGVGHCHQAGEKGSYLDTKYQTTVKKS